jgi:hypothetical protein
MFTIHARNVSEAWAQFHRLIVQPEFTREVRPRGVLTREVTSSVVTTYTHPEECVLLDPVRDCNPFFHLYEALWILSGHNDVARVKFYSPQISAYSDNSITFHGAYGYRWRQHFGFDQLPQLIYLLKKDPDTRRAVLQMWGADDLWEADKGLDVPCNTAAYFQLREGALSVTVTNRSNDAVWGAYGANAVQFSVLLQYVAAAVGARVGSYTQMSNSLHVYLEGKAGDVWQRCASTPPPLLDDYAPAGEHLPLVQDPDTFLYEVSKLTAPADGSPAQYGYQEPWIRSVAAPMCVAHWLYRKESIPAALLALSLEGVSDPWLVAGRQWLQRRLDKREGGQR